MNYANQSTGTQSLGDNAPQKAKAFETAMNRLRGVNSEISSYCYQIEEKIHAILNLREPEKLNESQNIPKIADFITDLGTELNTSENNLRRLVKIYEHLNQII